VYIQPFALEACFIYPVFETQGMPTIPDCRSLSPKMAILQWTGIHALGCWLTLGLAFWLIEFLRMILHDFQG
jgi:hypothetical protein